MRANYTFRWRHSRSYIQVLLNASVKNKKKIKLNLKNISFNYYYLVFYSQEPANLPAYVDTKLSFFTNYIYTYLQRTVSWIEKQKLMTKYF